MNRHRHEFRAGALPVSVLVAAVALAACGGIIRVCYKNCGIEIARRIARAENRTAQYEDEIRTLRRRTEEMLNCFAMGEDLELNGSELRPIPPGAIEVIASDDSSSGVEMASNQP